jgi:Raf kinase inhibitor-like YbhB/YbcL family protein
MNPAGEGANMKKYLVIVLAVFLILALALPLGCTKKEKKESAKEEQTTKTKSNETDKTESKKETEFVVTSPAFDNDSDIPPKYAHNSAGGENVSIPLQWKNAPEGTESFAVAMVDTHPDANNFLHWLVINIPPDTTSLDEGASGNNMPEDATEFKNGYGEDGYGGPAPPAGSGEHDYEITVYALSIPSMSMTENAGLSEFDSFTKDKVLGKATISGEFSR